MTNETRSPKIGYVVKMFPRLSETFVLNEILELEGRGAEIVIFSMNKPNEGRFHPQLSRLKAQVFYLEDLDPKKFAAWLAPEWPMPSASRRRLWNLLDEAMAIGDPRRVDLIWHAAWIAAQARKTGITRLHAHFASLPSTIAYLAHRISGLPFSFTAHAKDIFVYAPEEHDLREKMAAAQFVVTVTEFNRRFLRERVPEIDAAKVEVIQNGVDLEAIEPGDPDRRSADLVLAVGRLVPKKGFSTLLAACTLLKERGRRFRCVIAGAGPDAAALETQRRELGLENDVVLAGALTQEEVFSLMKEATVFCLPCTVGPDNNVDALPTVLLEAQACGLPVISTTVSGIPEIVDSGIDGLLVPPDDPHALSEQIDALLSAPDVRARLAKNGLEKVRRKFDLQRNVGRLLELYNGQPGGEAGAGRGHRSDGDERGPAVDGPRSASRDPIGAPDPGHGARVLYLCADRGIPFGGNKGASVHLREFAVALERVGYTPHVMVARRDFSAAFVPSCAVSTLPEDAIGPFFAEIEGMRLQTPAVQDTREFLRNESIARVLHQVHRHEGFDLLLERYSLFGVAGREFARKAGVPYVLEVNAPLVEEAPRYRPLEALELARAVEAYLFSGADHILVVSENLRDYVHTIAPGASVTVVPNGVNVARFTAAVDRSAVRSRLTTRAQEGFLIGFVGRVRPWHGVEHLIDAVGRIAADGPAELCVVGHCGDAEAALTGRCRVAGLDGRARFTGPVPPDEVPGILQSVDVLAAPYPEQPHFYFSPLKIFEYMASGTAIVASAIGQITDILEHERTALLVPPGDIDALARALARLRADARLRRELGENARAEACEKHDWGRRADTVAGIFRALLSAEHVDRTDTIQTR